MNIRFIAREEIEEVRWTEISGLTHNRMIYNQLWYIDALTDRRWGALVADDYEFMLPLPFRTKGGLPYIYQPFITQRFQVSGRRLPDETVTASILAAIPKRFVLVNLTLADNPGSIKNVTVSERTNHILHLNTDYHSIAGNYNRNTRRNLQAASAYPLTFDLHRNFDDFIRYQTEWEPFPFTRPNVDLVKNLWLNMEREANPFLVTCFLDDIPVAVAMFCVYGGRLYFLLCASNSRGKEVRAMFRLIDTVIQRHAGQNLIFDFTGSSIPDIARRNEGFGATTEKLYAIERGGFIASLRKWLIRR